MSELVSEKAGEVAGTGAENPDERTVRSHRSEKKQKRKPVLRPWIRAIHRDAGYLAFGLTMIYAVSGLAVNHVADYTDGDANFTKYEREVTLSPFTGDDDAIAKSAMQQLGIHETAKEVFRAGPDELQVSFEKRSLTIHPSTGTVHDEGQRARFFVRLANWLHLNRGKKAWTYVADSYAIVLIFLAGSGLFMIPGRKGLLGRGLVLALLGAAIPAGYVVLSGGP
jgi:uncharacterized protein